MATFEHPYGFLCFLSNFEFTSALIFSQDRNLDVSDFSFFGLNFIAVFSVHDFFYLVFFCEEEALNFVKYICL